MPGPQVEEDQELYQGLFGNPNPPSLGEASAKRRTRAQILTSSRPGICSAIRRRSSDKATLILGQAVEAIARNSLLFVLVSTNSHTLVPRQTNPVARLHRIPPGFV